jgi:predicted polyphosphate/ATP-dependent NAD kinase
MDTKRRHTHPPAAGQGASPLMTVSDESRRIGLIVNPIAGLGGPAGLHGTDGEGTWRRAEALGSTRRAESLTLEFLTAMGSAAPTVSWLAPPGSMGEASLEHASLRCRVVEPNLVPAGVPADERAFRSPVTLRGSAAAGSSINCAGVADTTAADTTAAAATMARIGVDLLVFAGGDGTARDVLAGLSADIPMVGIPAGVKMQSAVFGRSAASTAASVRQWLERTETIRAEVVDIDEASRRRGILDSQLYGLATTIAAPSVVSGRKIGSAVPSPDAIMGMADEARRHLDPDSVWMLGPGRTVQQVAAQWGLSASLLGVDIVDAGKVAVTDATADDIRRLTRDREFQILLSPIGGQGFLLGRGNQQITEGLGDRLRVTDLVVVASPNKLADLQGGPLYADWGQSCLPDEPEHIRVITGRNQSAMVRLVRA